VMWNKPRRPDSHIITKPMAKNFIGVGVAFVVVLFGLIQYFKQADITSLTQFNFADFGRSYFDFSPGNGLSPYELSLFFTIFVFLQVWNMFNARAFMTGKSAFASIGDCKGLIFVVLMISVGQWVIVTVAGEMFNATPLKLVDWALIIGGTSVVLWIGEIRRLFTRVK